MPPGIMKSARNDESGRSVDVGSFWTARVPTLAHAPAGAAEGAGDEGSAGLVAGDLGPLEHYIGSSASVEKIQGL